MNLKKTAVASAVALFMGTGAAHAALVTVGSAQNFGTTNNFSMLGGTDKGNVIPSAQGVGGPSQIGGTNDVHASWDGTAFNSASDFVASGFGGNMTISSTTPFFGVTWAARDIQVFTPGSYAFTYLAQGTSTPTTFNMTVGAGQLGVHMLFDWNNNNGINVFSLWGMNAAFAGNMYTGPGGSNSASQVWNLVSVDTAMPDGPFAGNKANFNLGPAAVPVPAAVWLFGSGLLGLVGIARRKKKA
ncbi:MAG: VPLPA-CTERM sorting domain-containing protein [Sulfuricaulis sp.]